MPFPFFGHGRGSVWPLKMKAETSRSTTRLVPPIIAFNAIVFPSRDQAGCGSQRSSPFR